MRSQNPPLPNFFIIGVPKAGTTSLFHYLDQHPQIYLSPIKEPTFFAASDLLSGGLREHVVRRMERDRSSLQAHLNGPMSERFHDRLVLEWADYLQLFRNVQSETAIGEASASYFYLPSAARAIRACVPDAKLIVILRHPAERAFSQYLAARWDGARPSFREYFEAAVAQPDYGSLWLEVGRYGTHLKRILDIFPRVQLHTILYEDFRNDARGTLRELLTYLGVDPDFPIDLSRRHNEPLVPRYPWLHALGRIVPARLDLRQWLPQRVRRITRARLLQQRVEIHMDSKDRQLVTGYYRDEIIRASGLIGRDLSAWLR